MPSRSRAFVGAMVVLLWGVLSSCGTGSAGPQAWIDKPLDNTTAPLAPLSLLAHASAIGGVASIEFVVDDESYRTVAADGGPLEWQQVEWNPPGPGTYRVGARGIGTDGTVGALASSLVTIAGGEQSPPPAVPETAAAVTPQATITPITPAPPRAASVVARMNANCRKGPGTAFDSDASLLAGESAEIRGRLADNSWLLISLSGRSANCWIAASVADVNGNLSLVQVVPGVEPPPAAAGSPPTADIIAPAPIQIDNPPTIHQIDAAREACPTDGVRVAAIVADDKGVGGVTANWTLSSGESGQLGLSLGWLGYWGIIAPGTEGTLRIRMVATDTSGQSTTSDWLVLEFQKCIK